MSYYFKLQFTRLKRLLVEFGINPMLGLLLAIVIFVALSKMLFFKLQFANWIYLAIASLWVFNLSANDRNNTLRNIFITRDYFKVRMIENAMIAFPFVVYLLFEKEFLAALVLMPIAIILAMIKIKQSWSRTIPTPFRKFPFEFIVGFRKTFWLIGISYFLLVQAILVDNYNLGLFSMAAIFFTSMYYYVNPEQEYFVWIYSDRAVPFLKKKFLTAVICVSILSFLSLLGLFFYFPEKWMFTLLVYLLGFIFLGSMIVAKYSAYPHQMNIPQGILYSASLLFPPLLIITIWIFYSKSKKRLEPILG